MSYPPKPDPRETYEGSSRLSKRRRSDVDEPAEIPSQGSDARPRPEEGPSQGVEFRIPLQEATETPTRPKQARSAPKTSHMTLIS